MTNNDKEERVINREQFDLIEEPWLEWASLPLAPTPQQHTDEEYEEVERQFKLTEAALMTERNNIKELKEKADAWDRYCELSAELHEYIGFERTPNDVMIAEQKRKKTIAELEARIKELEKDNDELTLMIIQRDKEIEIKKVLNS